jgi:hypothetical protein
MRSARLRYCSQGGHCACGSSAPAPPSAADRATAAWSAGRSVDPTRLCCCGASIQNPACWAVESSPMRMGGKSALIFYMIERSRILRPSRRCVTKRAILSTTYSILIYLIVQFPPRLLILTVRSPQNPQSINFSGTHMRLLCPLAAAAFDCGLEFNPPPWAEKLRLALKENSPGMKTGGRIKCPVHLREAMTNFHSDLYLRKFIVPATGCETYASVLIIRKPDDANGKPRGFRFVVDLRNRNETIVACDPLPE